MPITDGVKIFIKNKQLNQFVLMLRDDKPTIPLPNMWCLFGGGIDEDETPLAAVERELTEEIDIPVYAIRHIHTMPIQHQVQGVITNITGYYYLGYTDVDDLSEVSFHEGQKIGFFSAEEILATPNMAYPTKELLELCKDELR